MGRSSGLHQSRSDGESGRRGGPGAKGQRKDLHSEIGLHTRLRTLHYGRIDFVPEPSLQTLQGVENETVSAFPYPFTVTFRGPRQGYAARKLVCGSAPYSAANVQTGLLGPI
ncbi:hypothetical protein VTK56DRAFT_3769 [Thermocarpiscus australiensis]